MSMLIPAKMKKVVLVGLREHRERVLSLLHDMRAVQVEPLGKEALSYFAAEKGGSSERALADTTLRFKALVSALPRVPVTVKEHFPDTSALLKAAGEVTIDPQVHDLKRKEDALLTTEKNLKDTADTLREFSFFNDDMALLRARSIFSFFGVIPAPRYEAYRSEIRTLSEDLHITSPVMDPDGKRARFVVVVPREAAEPFARVTHKHNAKLTAVPPERNGTPVAAGKEVEATLEGVSKDLKVVRDHLLQISQQWYAKILPIEEELVVEARKAEVLGKLGKSDSCFALEGWVPAKDYPRLEAGIKKVTGDTCFLASKVEHEGAPTLLTNPRGFRVYEFFIRFYSLPQSGEIDPTLVFAIMFPIFYGLMLADVGYAGFILAVCVWMIWRIGNPKAGPTVVPKFLVKFTTTVVPPGAMKQLAKTLVPGCLIGLSLGIAFDSYFGFTLGQLTLGHVDFALITSKNGIPGQVVYVAKLLLLSVYIGIAMVTLGLVFGMINAYFHRKWLHLVGRFCWILLAWGVTLLGLSLVHHYPGSWLIAYHAYFYEYVAMAVVGMVGVIGAEGIMAAVEIPSIMSHVLSYARLVGILLASVILAYVINFIAVIGSASQPAMISHGIAYALLAVVIVVIGAVFNIILGVFEPGIQGARLLYVEYFSKFYAGNGRPFSPFGGPRRYTKPQILDQHPELRAR